MYQFVIDIHVQAKYIFIAGLKAKYMQTVKRLSKTVKAGSLVTVIKRNRVLICFENGSNSCIINNASSFDVLHAYLDFILLKKINAKLGNAAVTVIWTVISV